MPKIVDREVMQARILDAALACFLRQGYHETKMTDVAKAADMAKGTVYLYFKGKDELTLALIQRYFNDLRAQIAAYPMPPTLEIFVFALRQSLQPARLQSTRMMFDIFGPGFDRPEARAVLAEFFDWLGAHYAQTLTMLHQTGQLRPELDPDQAGRALAALLDGLVVHLSMFAADDARFTERVDAAMQIIEAGLCRS